jgi:tartrate-resistant acid phosphatase type 5
MQALLPVVALCVLTVSCSAPAPVDVGLTHGADAPAEETLRFVAVGDTGKGNDIQRQVGRAIAATCGARGGCSFALLLGDNIYPSGAASDDDAQFLTKFEEPFGLLSMPFRVVLGNHDYGAGGAGWAFWKATHEIAWSSRSPRWQLPARHYGFTASHADFFALDTTALFWGYEADQRTALHARLAASTRPWRIAFGHHPRLSNGKHGDAGHYDRLAPVLPGSGERWRRFFDGELCGRVDLYLSGHDHNLADLGDLCGVAQVVSGAGSSPYRLSRNDRGFSVAEPGFAVVEATAQRLSWTFFDADGRPLHERALLR